MQTLVDTQPVPEVVVAPAAAPVYRFRHIPSLDGLRALAVVMVFLMHSPYGPTIATGGHTGVDIFLVLSGFLITSILAQEWRVKGDFSLKRFYLRRVLRLAPAMLVCAAAMIAWDVRHDYLQWDAVRRYALSVVFYYTNLGNFFGLPVPPGLAHMWSLSLEEQYYLIWPWVLGALLRRSPRLALWSTAALMVATSLWEFVVSHGDTTSNSRLYLCLDTRANAALLGSALALIPWAVSEQARAAFGRFCARFSPAALAIIVLGVYFIPNPVQTVQMVTIPCILASGLLVAAFAFGPATPLRLWFERPKLVTLGKLSYSFYLWHFPMIFWVTTHLTPHRSRLDNSILSFLLALGCAWLSYTKIETPFLRLKRRFEGLAA